MENNFLSYEHSTMLKELGFKEECFAWYNWDKVLIMFGADNLLDGYAGEDGRPHAPTYQQIEKWLWETHKCHFQIFQGLVSESPFRVNICIGNSNMPVIHTTEWRFDSPIQTKMESINKTIEYLHQQIKK